MSKFRSWCALLYDDVVSWQSREQVLRLPWQHADNIEEANLGNRVKKVLLRRNRSLGIYPSQTLLTTSETILINSIPGVASRDSLDVQSSSHPVAPGLCLPEGAQLSVAAPTVSPNIDCYKRINKALLAESPPKLRRIVDCSGVAEPAAKIESTSSSLTAAALQDKALLVQIKRPHYDAIMAGRKKWEARPLQFASKHNGWKQTHYDKLATVGRTVVLQSGAGTNDRLQISEVRRYTTNDSVELQDLRNMVRELGSDLLPDTEDEEARIEVYQALYGEEQCSKGFVAMRLEWPGHGQSSPNMTFKQRTCNSAAGCGKICCDSCCPAGGRYSKRK